MKPLKTAQLREWLIAEARGEITYGKVLQNINDYYFPKTMKCIEFELWIKNIIEDQTVCVLGAGPSISRYDREYFKKRFDIVIGVNWIHQNFTVDLSVCTHFKMVHHHLQEQQQGNTYPTVVYSRQTSDIGCMANNPKIDGIVFDAYKDLWLGSSTIITAIHLASFFSDTVHLFGVDLKRASDDRMYCNGYAMETDNKPSNEHFDDWAKVVELEIEGLRKMLKIKLIRN